MKTKLLIIFLIFYCVTSTIASGINDLITEAQFNAMFPNRNTYASNAEYQTNPTNKSLFSYTNLVNAAATFPLFCNEGDINVRKRELAAFLANTSHETTGGWGGYVPIASDYQGRYAWGYCFPREFGYNPSMSGQYCDAGSVEFPPVSGQSYYGRGPVQLSWNYNYGAFSQAVLGDKNILLSNPEKVLEDGTIFFQSALWFWMSPQTGGSGITYLKPSCHDVMVNLWTPTDPQQTNNSLTPGFPVTINIINGGLESGPNRSNQHGPDDRLGFYLRYCEILNVDAIDSNWGYESQYSFSTWDMESEIHKKLNSYYPDNFTLHTRSQGSKTLRGYVKDASGKGVARCHIALINNTTYYEQAVTDDNGMYVISKIPNASYQVVASKGDFTFSPSNLSVTVSSDTTTTDIIATDPNATIVSGTVSDVNGNGIKDVVVDIIGATNYSTQTDATGKYIITPLAGTYTQVFTKSNYSFSINNSIITIVAGDTITQNNTGNYSGLYYTISGNIKNSTNENFEGVTVNLTGGSSRITTSDSNGNYSFTNLEQNLNYMVTPSMSGSLFTPYAILNLRGDSVANFTAQKSTCIAGKITISGIPLAGVNMKISNLADVIVTDTEGNYTTPALQNGSNYMITPQKDGYIFEPTYKYYSAISQSDSLAFTAKAVTGSPKKRIIYYYPEWATYTRNYQVKDIDATYLTNILFAFVTPFYVDGSKNIDDDIPYRSGKNGKVISVENITVDGVAKSVGLAIVDEFADIQKFPTGGIDLETGTGTGGTYITTCTEWLNAPYKTRGGLGQLVQLRKKIKNETGRDIQIQISIGGWTLAQAFPLIADNQLASDAFGRACKTFLDKSTYDGVDIDWEFPVSGGTDGTETIDGSLVSAQPHTLRDATNFTRLMKSIRTSIGTDKLLTMASSQNPTKILDQYVFPGTMSRFGVTDNCLDYLDYIQTMSYDYGGYWSGVATHECPLYNSNNVNDENKNMSVATLIDTLLSKTGANIPANKIVMGLPFYGKIWADIQDGGTNGLYQTNAKITKMPGSWDTGSTPVNEASTSIDFGDLKHGKALTKHQYLNLPSSGFVEYWDDVVKCPYLYNPNTKIFVSYDDENSLAEKVKFLNNHYLLGAMVWEVTQDDNDKTLMKTVYNNIQQAKLKIDGTIVDSNEQGISGVNVVLSGGASITVITTEDGKFSFPNLEPGLSYNVEISKSGFAFLDDSYSFQAIQMSKELKVIGSESSFSITGKLKLTNGTLLPESNIAIYKGSDLLKTIESSDGNYSFSNIPGGFSYTLKAYKTNHVCSTGDVSITNLSDNVSQDFEFTINKYRISGYIRNSSDIGVSGILVNLTGSAVATLTTDSNGFYQTDSLNANGTYVISPSRLNSTFAPAYHEFNGLTSDIISDFIITEETMLFGYVKDGNLPIANVPVRMIPAWMGTHPWSTYTNQSTKTDANGYYEFRNGPATIATLTLTCNTDWDKLSYNFKPLSDTTWVNFTGVHRVDWNTKPATFNVSGSIKDISNNPVSNVNVHLKSDTVMLATSTTDAVGNYSFSVLKNTNCHIEPILANYSFTPAVINLGHVTADVTANFTGTFSGDYSIVSGTVYKSDNSPFANATVKIIGVATKMVTTGDDGTFSFSDIPNGFDYVLKVAYAGSSFIPDSTLLPNLSGNSSSNNFTEKEKTYYGISGYVKKENGTPLSNVNISLSGNNQTLSSTTDINGYYVFNNILGDNSYQLIPTRSGMKFSPETISIAKLTSNSENNFVLNEGTYIYGYVKDGIIPVAGAKVQIVLNWTSSSAGYQSLILASNAEGYYEYSVTGDYIGGNGGTVKVNSWDNNNITYYPELGYTLGSLLESKECSFNKQPLTTNNVSSLNSDLIIKVVNGQITLQFIQYLNPKGFVEVYSSLGQMITSESISKDHVVIPKSFSSGIYFLKINIGEKIITRRLIIK